MKLCNPLAWDFKALQKIKRKSTKRNRQEKKTRERDFFINAEGKLKSIYFDC